MFLYKTKDGESFYEFEATIGEAIEPVIVTLAFEYDHAGSYNEYIAHVMYQGIDIAGCLTLEALNSLEMDGIFKRDTQALELSKDQ